MTGAVTRSGGDRPWIRIGLVWAGVSGCVAVAAGAYATHGVGDVQGAAWMTTASGYQLWHALALLGVVLAAGRRPGWPDRLLGLAGVCFGLGSLLFCGALYTLALIGAGPLTALAPVGGTLLMLGWLAVAASALAPSRR
ncbi:MAG: DUF423 domain-containing protein [Azospirillaceae bacterium]|nr:DUF423 domain-containing protein [Azospirillaceae bacterium]